jgi:hypothetical protein
MEVVLQPESDIAGKFTTSEGVNVIYNKANGHHLISFGCG